MTPLLNGPKHDDEIDVHALTGALLDRKRLIITVTVLFFAISMAYAFLATPVYQAQAMVQVQQAPELQGMTGLNPSYGATNPEATDALSILTSDSVIGKAVDDYDLNTVISAYRFPLIGSFIARHHVPDKSGDVAAPWFGISRYDWGGSQLKIPELEVSNDWLGEDLTLIAGKNGEYTLWDDSILPILDKLLLQGKTGQVAHGSGITMLVTVLRANPGTHFNVVRNDRAYTIGQLSRAVQANQPGKDSNVITLAFNSVSPRLAVKVLDDITQAYVAQNVGRNSAQASKSLEFVQQQLPVARAKLEKAQDALNAFQVSAHSVDVPMQTQSLLNQETMADTSIQQLEIQKAEVERLYTPNHPAYQAIEKQIGQLEAQKAGMLKQLNGMPDTQREMLRLSGNVQVLDNTYNGLLNEAQQLQIAQAGSVGDVRVVDDAAVDITTPAKPKKLLVVLGGTFLGIFASVGYIFLRRMLNRRLENPIEIEQLGLPVYASIPLSHKKDTRRIRRMYRYGAAPRHLLALAAPDDLATEALRSLRTSLYFAQQKARNNLLMISGSSPNAGKTFISANLATLMAQGGQKVLLIDANLRDGSLHEVLGGRAENGLSELIGGHIQLPDGVRVVDGVDNLHFIARGRIPSQPAELLMDPRFAFLLQRLSHEYEQVIIDSPPILAVTDAALIGQHVGINLLVARFGVDQSGEIELAKHRFGSSGVDVDGVVFNAVEPRNANTTSYTYFAYPIAK